MLDNYEIGKLNPKKNPYVTDKNDNFLEYKGYRTYMKYDATDNILVGELIGIDDIVAFHGSSIDEFIAIFHRVVDDYIGSCKELGKDIRPEYDFSDAIKNPYVSNSVKKVNQEDMTSEDAIKEEDMEIPPSLVANLIEWMRNKGISDEDIVDCMLYICSGK